MKQEINIIKAELERFFKDDTRVVFAYLHGSILHDVDSYNDLDVAIYIDEDFVDTKKTYDLEIDLSLELEKIFRKPVDVKILNNVFTGFAYHATSGLLVYCRDELCRYNFLEKTWQLYFDFQPHVKAYLKDLVTGT
ncbi:nucleotidyltransferase domain-containing protein [Desulfofalx alkaliphila]|uniref:nucleotidyltransferase domain-containing protein n=1 Tax=Desulfofalx alkaliphila TaxID=105483 RepID=UPI0004E15DA6|nr:nucleotidyltransferase domain-containing protein [Desulfofalx alkaliphila]